MNYLSANLPQRFLQSRFLLYCAICLLLIKIFSVVVYINLPLNIFFADITKSALVSFVNQARQSSGLQPLVVNQKLDQAAKLKAEDMVQKQYFSHTNPQGVLPWYWFKTIGYNYKYAGENLAIGFFDSKEVYEAWLNSPSHKANLLNSNYKEVGTAVLGGFGFNNTVVVVQLFGSQQPAKAPSNIVSQPKTKTETEPKNTAPASPAITDTANEKVLSQSTELPAVTEKQQGNFTPYNYGAALQDVIFGFLLIVIGALLFIIFFDSVSTAKKQLIFRSLIIIALLSVSALLNKELIIAIIPHQIII